MIVINTQYGDLYDKDGSNGAITKISRCFHSDNSITFNKFDYANNFDGEYRKATVKELEEWQCTYYLEDGNRPLKIKDCDKCLIKNTCGHNQKYYKAQ